MNSSTQSTATILPDPFPGDEIAIVAYERVLYGEVLGSGYDRLGLPIYHVFLTAPDEDLMAVREVWAYRYELAEV